MLLIWTSGAIYAQKMDTIAIEKGLYLVKAGDSFVMNDMAKQIIELWHKDVGKHQTIMRGMYHNWPMMIGLNRESLIAIIGQPNFYLPDRYMYEYDISPEGIFFGCWLGVGYTDGKVSYLGVECPH